LGLSLGFYLGIFIPIGFAIITLVGILIIFFSKTSTRNQILSNTNEINMKKIKTQKIKRSNKYSGEKQTKSINKILNKEN
jgi:hypothetical protein